MLGIADHGTFCAAILLLLALPGLGAFGWLTSSGKGGSRAAVAATAGLSLVGCGLRWVRDR